MNENMKKKIQSQHQVHHCGLSLNQQAVIVEKMSKKQFAELYIWSNINCTNSCSFALGQNDKKNKQLH